MGSSDDDEDENMVAMLMMIQKHFSLGLLSMFYT